MIADGLLERLGRRPTRVSSRQRMTRTLLRGHRLPRPGPRTLLALVVIAGALGGGWLWLRDSSLVAVRRVTISGVSGPDARRIRSALMVAARNMTTLDVNAGQLNTAVAPYPVVKALRVSTQFPHGMRIRVVEEIPVGVITVAGRTIAVASDGMLLHDAGSLPRLPAVSLPSPPGGARISGAKSLGIIEMLAAAPGPLLSHISQATVNGSHGIVANLRHGPSIYFGDATRLAAKWEAAAAVLANGGSAGAQYVDVSDPGRPVAGASESSSTSAASSTSSAATSTATGTTAAASATAASPSTAGASTASTGG